MRLSPLHRSLLVRGTEDWVELWEVRLTVQRAKPDLSGEELREESVQLSRELLEAGYMTVGSVTEEAGFVPWDATIEQAMSRIKDTWDEWKWREDLGSQAWFQLTPEGQRVINEGNEP